MLEAHGGIVWQAEYFPHGDLLATGGDEGVVKIWNPTQSDPVKSFEHPAAVRGFACRLRGEAANSEARQEGQRFPMAKGHVRDEPMASMGSSLAPRHIGVEARFVADATPSTAFTSGITLKFCIQHYRGVAMFGFGAKLRDGEPLALYNA